MNVKELYDDRKARQNWDKKLNKLVGDIVKLRDQSCVLCGSRSNLTPGHVFGRGRDKVKYDLTNVYALCISCHNIDTVNHEPYYRWFKRKFGTDTFETLQAKSYELADYKLQDLKDIYKELLYVKQEYEK